MPSVGPIFDNNSFFLTKVQNKQKSFFKKRASFDTKAASFEEKVQSFLDFLASLDEGNHGGDRTQISDRARTALENARASIAHREEAVATELTAGAEGKVDVAALAEKKDSLGSATSITSGKVIQDGGITEGSLAGSGAITAGDAGASATTTVGSVIGDLPVSNAPTIGIPTPELEAPLLEGPIGEEAVAGGGAKGSEGTAETEAVVGTTPGGPNRDAVLGSALEKVNALLDEAGSLATGDVHLTAEEGAAKQARFEEIKVELGDIIGNTEFKGEKLLQGGGQQNADLSDVMESLEGTDLTSFGGIRDAAFNKIFPAVQQANTETQRLGFTNKADLVKLQEGVGANINGFYTGHGASVEDVEQFVNENREYFTDIQEFKALNTKTDEVGDFLKLSFNSPSGEERSVFLDKETGNFFREEGEFRGDDSFLWVD